MQGEAPMHVTRRAVNVLLVTWLAVIWACAILDVDIFPLTNAAMYATWKRQEILADVVVDMQAYKRGFTVTRRDGTSDVVSRKDLNLPYRQMYKLYYQKIHNRPVFNVFRTFNRTLGHAPDDPKFIVRITAPLEFMYRRVDDISKVWREKKVTTLVWDDAWRERW
jgi:hypothetical protein